MTLRAFSCRFSHTNACDAMNDKPSRYLDLIESIPFELVVAACVVIIALGLWYMLRVLGDRP
jgi:hypothetical protein